MSSARSGVQDVDSPLRRAAGRTFASLRSRNLRLFFGGLAISQIGSWMQLIALPWLVLEITDNGAMLGITYALQFLPILVLGAWAGVLADRSDKRRILFVTTTLLGAVGSPGTELEFAL